MPASKILSAYDAAVILFSVSSSLPTLPPTAQEVMARFENLKPIMGAESALDSLKVQYRSFKWVVSAIESFRFLLSKKLDREQMLMVVKAISDHEAKMGNIDMEPQYDAATTLNESIKRYKCKECNLEFESFQALGGHTASHKRKKIAESEVGYGREGFDSVGESKCLYECDLCLECFPSGQALRGHKTSHRKIFPGEASTSSTKQEMKYQFHFDLNKPPE